MGMSSVSKRWFFFGLIFIFLIYTVAVDTVGTEQDAGKNFMNENAKSGKLLYQKYNCTACHQVYGLGGYLGPDLTNVISEKNKGVIYARAILKNGTMRMPNFHLKENEVEELVSYLIYLNETGVSPVKKFDIMYDGTIKQKANK
jgi:nitric oxide reductase subunit C